MRARKGFGMFMKSDLSRKLIKLRYTRFFTIIKNGVWKDNPIFSMVLGICSALAVTNRVENALAMGLGVIFCLIASSLMTSLLRNLIPQRIRLITYMVIISTFVVTVDLFLKAYFSSISEALGPYVGLIITNCILMGRAEAFASKNKIKYSMLDGISNGVGYTGALLLISVIREILAFGSVLGYRVMPSGWTNWVVMSMAPGAFFVLAVILWIIRSIPRYVPEDEGCE